MIMKSRPYVYGGLLALFFLISPQWVVFSDRGFGFGLALFVAALWADFFFVQRKWELRWNHGCTLLSSMIVLTSMGAFFGDHSYLPWRTGLQYAALMSLVVLLAQPQFPLQYREIVRCSAALCSLFLILIVVDRALGLSVGGMDYWRGSGRLSFTFGNPNYLAAVQVIFFSLFLGDRLFGKAERGLDRHLSLAGAISASLILLQTGSRNGVLCWCLAMIVAIGWYFWRNRALGRRSFYLPFLILFTGGVILSVWLATEGQSTLVKFSELFEGGGASEMGRLTVWQVTLDLWRQSGSGVVIGHGWGSLYPMSMNYDAGNLLFRLDSVGILHAHSEPLELLLEGGLASVLLFLGFLWWVLRQIKDLPKGSDRDKAVIISFALLILLCFSCISVATRYAVVLLSTAILLGLLIRVLGGGFQMSRRVGLVFYGILGIFIIGNVYVAGRHYVSDVCLNRAFKTEGSTASEWYRRAVAVAPERVSPRYEQLIHFCRDPDPSLKATVRAAFDEIGAVIPNYKNVSEFYASYLAEIGDFSGAAKQMDSLAEIRTFHLMYLADASFYYLVSQDATRARMTLREILYRAFLAESRSSRGTVQSVEWLGSERARINVYFDGRVEELRADTLSARIPDKVRFNQVIFRYYALAETHRILSETIEDLNTPRFLELLSADDKDKVLRLAKKLEEVEARTD